MRGAISLRLTPMDREVTYTSHKLELVAQVRTHGDKLAVGRGLEEVSVMEL